MLSSQVRRRVRRIQLASHTLAGLKAVPTEGGGGALPRVPSIPRKGAPR